MGRASLSGSPRFGARAVSVLEVSSMRDYSRLHSKKQMVMVGLFFINKNPKLIGTAVHKP